MNELEEIVIEYEKLNPRESRAAHRQLLQMRMYIKQMEADAYLATMTYLDHLAALRKQAAEIAALKAQLNACKHPMVTVHSKLWAAATYDMPAEYIQRAQCDACGKWMDTSDIPEDSEVSE